MPRYAANDRFQIGDFWLSKQARSNAWCRTWFDTSTRQTRRASLGTTDFEQAKQHLTDWFVLEHTKRNEPIDDVTLGEVFARFYEQHGQTLATHKDVRRTLDTWLQFYQAATISEATQQDQQRLFREWLQQEKGYSLSTVRRALLVGKSALNWAYKRGEIGQPPYIELVKPPRAEPKGRPLEIDEVASLFRAATEPHLRILMAFMLGTAARTGAILDLQLSQIDLNSMLIDLNPPCRSQTNKYRPIVKLPEQLKAYVEARKAQNPDGPLVHYNGQPVSSIKNSWRSTRKASGLSGNVQTYSFRHTIARWLRMNGVPAWEVAAQLGHKMPDVTTTEIYAPFDPAYLSKSISAIDEFLSTVVQVLEYDNLTDALDQ